VLRWTWNSLIAEPWHLLASVGAIGGAFALVLFFEAVFAGESRQIVAYARHADADVWVMQRGVSNMHMATSFVSDWKADRIARIEGVSKVTPILYLNTVMRAGSGNWFSFIVGLDPADPRAGPWSVTQGKRLPVSGEALVPAVLVRLAGLSLGDSISIAGQRFVVAGLTEGTFSMANSITFVTLQDLAEVMSTFGTMSYFLVDAAPGVDAARLAERIERDVEKVNAVPNEEFIRNDWAVAMQMGVEIISLMTVIGGALAVLLTGFAVYSSAARRERELAVMKALGFRNRAIYASVMAQAGAMAVLGFLLATSLVFIATPLTAHFVPQVTLQVSPDALLRVFVATLVVALLACVIPVRRVVRVDPLSAFRG
jgi:putative ABC transport system permease protein